MLLPLMARSGLYSEPTSHHILCGLLGPGRGIDAHEELAQKCKGTKAPPAACCASFGPLVVGIAVGAAVCGVAVGHFVARRSATSS